MEIHIIPLIVALINFFLLIGLFILIYRLIIKSKNQTILKEMENLNKKIDELLIKKNQK